MILIAGLGNPGEKYAHTRHNFGFMVLDALAAEIKAEFKDSPKFHARTAEATLTFPGERKHARVILVKPETYMNESGKAVGEIRKYYKLRPEDQIWVVHDDLDVDLGTIRIRVNGSSAGQKGVQSIIDHLGTEEFVRLRMGIRPEGGQPKAAEEFVLEKFRPEEKRIADKEIEEAVKILIEAINKGFENRSI